MVAVAIGAAAVVGGGASIISGNKAAKATTKAADQVVASNERQAAQDRADLAPWRTVGGAAIGKLGGVYNLAGGTPATNPDGTPAAYGGFETSPGYEFRKAEGIKAVERGAAARGLLGSGAAVKATERFAEGNAASEYDSWWNRLAGLAGVGQAATNTGIQAGQNTTNNISSAYTTAGNARASSYLNTGSAINGTLNNLASVYAFNAGGGFKPPAYNPPSYNPHAGNI